MNTPNLGRIVSRNRLTKLPFLASPLLQFNLVEELRQLREQDSWRRMSGRSSKTLVKHPDFHIVLILMKAKSRMSEHHIDARISMQLLQGKILIELPDRQMEVRAGELFALDYGRKAPFSLRFRGRAAQKKSGMRSMGIREHL